MRRSRTTSSQPFTSLFASRSTRYTARAGRLTGINIGATSTLRPRASIAHINSVRLFSNYQPPNPTPSTSTMSQSHQNTEAAAFLSRLATDGLDTALTPALEYEAELRRLFARDRSNKLLADPHVGLVDVFNSDCDVLATQARATSDDSEHIFALPADQRRPTGSPALVQSLEVFQRNWSVFTEGALSQVDWSNVVVAGGAVQACLAPLPEGADDSRKALRKRFHEGEAYAASDVDLFLYGLDQTQAERKIQQIFDAIRDAVPWDVTAVRTAHALSIHSQYPYRPIQIVLRLYASPAEVLAGFDVDCCAVAYTPGKVLASPRALAAHIRQANLADPARRSPSYEVRLAKYAARGFEIHVPGLRRGDVDPQIFERSIGRVQGLARLLVLEKLRDAPSRAGYVSMRAELRGRPGNTASRFSLDNGGSHYKSDLKAKGAFADLDVELSGYDRGALRIPYGPGWHAARIEKLIWKTDMGMNSPFNPRNKKRRLHRHPAFFGDIRESMEDCCRACPAHENAEEEKQQKDEDERGSYVRGRISFIKDDPGRQSMTGSFRPLDAHEWAAQTYVRAQERLLAAAAADDVPALKVFIEQIQQQKQTDDDDARMEASEEAGGEEPLDLDARDCTGRTPLHVAILAGARGAALELIESGARMAPRLVGGRTSLHLAAQAGMDDVVRALLARSERNRLEAEAKGTASEAGEEEMAVDEEEEEDENSDVESSADGEEDWEQVKPSDAHPSPTPADSADALEDPPADAPDILDPAAPDWDFGFSPLIYAVLSSSLPSVTALLDAGAPADKPTKNGLHPLAATLFTRDSAAAADIARALVGKGASSTVADRNWLSILHRIISAPGRADVVRALLESDINGAQAARDAPAWESKYLVRPFGTAVATGNYAAMAVLAAFGAQLEMSEEDVSRAVDARSKQNWLGNAEDWRERVRRPLELALARGEGVAGIKLLLALGAKADAPPREAIALGSKDDVGKKYASLADWAAEAVKALDAAIERQYAPKPKESTPAPVQGADPAQAKNWAEWRAAMVDAVKALRLPSDHTGGRMLLPFHGVSNDSPFEKRDLAELEGMRKHYAALEALLREQPGMPPAPQVKEKTEEPKGKKDTNEYVEYRRLDGIGNSEAVPSHLRARYDTLYEAIWTGDNKGIQQLCVTDEEPIQIAVMATNAHPHGDIWPGRQGYTPLMVAIERKHWDTAKLILSIAAAQHKKPDEEASYNANEGLSDDDSESESMDIDEESEPEPISFTDIAARPSLIQCRVSPADLLDVEGAWPNGDKLATAPALHRAMYTGDIDTFNRVLELYTHAKADPADKWMTLDVILRQDRAEFLDVYIRATGAGIFPSRNNPPTIEKDEDDVNNAQRKKDERVYLGLDIHGAKRADKRKTSPLQLAVGAISDPMVRLAAGYGSLQVLEYLSSSRPLSAYQAFVDAHPDKKNARNIVKSASEAELPNALRRWLGWNLNVLNESVLLNAICADRLDVVRSLFGLEPELMSDCLLARAKFSGLTPLLAAVRAGVQAELFDYLLARGADPAEHDARGWNVFHILAAVDEREKDKYEKYEKLAKHLVDKLPQDLVLALLGQQSYGAQNTPLMLAVKQDRPALVALYTSLHLPDSVYLARDASASTVLHAAAQHAYTSLARALAAAGPPELLHIENGVGQTASEVAGLRLLNTWAESGSGSLPSVKWDLPVSENALAKLKPLSPEKGLRGRTEELRRILEALVQAGKLEGATDLGKALFAFVEAMEAKVASLTTSDIESADEDVLQTDVEQTYVALFDAARARPAKRRLVHVLDVQRSVELAVKQAAREREEEKAAYTPYYERERTFEDQLKAASIFGDGGMSMYRRRRHGVPVTSSWFVEADEIY
ncbi:ankyrin [Peniophora sp. CONT]|nr:ankyrin [Peniophora sp. CONT]